MAEGEGVYAIVSNIPGSFHSSDLRNNFSEFIETQGFKCFHFRHRPQAFSTSETVNLKSSNEEVLRRLCCVIKVDESRFQELCKRYDGKHWCDKKGDSIPLKCFIKRIKITSNEEQQTQLYKTRSESRQISVDRLELTFSDIQNFKELHPPPAMPNGNVGTATQVFLQLIRACRLPATIIRKLGLEFPRSRAKRMYGSVPFDYGGKCVSEINDGDDVVRTRSGHILSVNLADSSNSHPSKTSFLDNGKCDSTSVSADDEDDDRCEEWERHESLHNDVTQQERTKERLYEEEIELKWEKGGSGLVFYTDAQYWDEIEGDFDAKTADDWDVDMSIYYEQGAGDKDARDMMNMRMEKALRNGTMSSTLEHDGIQNGKQISPRLCDTKNYRKRKFICDIDDNDVSKIGGFEKHTKGIGRRLLTIQGWKEGQGIGKSVGISVPIEEYGQHPLDRKGLGFRGEKLNRHPISKNKAYIGSVYCDPKLSDPPVPLNRSDFLTRLSYRQGFLKSKESWT